MMKWICRIFLFFSANSLCADHYALGFEKICDHPEVYLCEHFISDEECEHMIKLSLPSLARSTVVDPGSKNTLVDARRSSSGMFLSPFLQDIVVDRIQERIASVTSIPIENGEGFQILHYDIGGEYRPHFDYFDPNTTGGLFHFNRGGQRVASLLIYLDTTEEGGETIFPKANLKIRPMKGRAVLFYNVTPDGNPDPMSLHGGAPVIKGEKWLMTKWLRERKFE